VLLIVDEGDDDVARDDREVLEYDEEVLLRPGEDVDEERDEVVDRELLLEPGVDTDEEREDVVSNDDEPNVWEGPVRLERAKAEDDVLAIFMLDTDAETVDVDGKPLEDWDEELEETERVPTEDDVLPIFMLDTGDETVVEDDGPFDDWDEALDAVDLIPSATDVLLISVLVPGDETVGEDDDPLNN
jgi:hypothetical protein